MLHNKLLILKTVLIFLSVYLISLLLWIQIKDTYGYVMTATASKLVAEVKNVQVEKMWQEKGIVYASFCRSLRKEDLVIDLAFKTSSYTFNVPLTLSIMASLVISPEDHGPMQRLSCCLSLSILSTCFPWGRNT